MTKYHERQPRYYLVTRSAPFLLWDAIRSVVDSHKAELVSIDHLAIRSITDQDEKNMETRQDAAFQFKILVDDNEDLNVAYATADCVMEDAIEYQENEEEEDEDD